MVLLYLKIVSEFSLYASIINGSRELFSSSINFLPVILIMALAPCVSKFLYDKFGGNIRLLGIIPVIICFFLSELNFANITLLLPIAVYSIAMVLRHGVDVEYYTFKKQFLLWSIIGAITFFFCYGLHVYMGHDAKEMRAGLLYYLIFFMLGIVVARRLRYSDEKKSVDSIKSIASVGVMALIGTGIYKLFDIFGNEISSGIRQVIMVIFIPLGWLYEKFFGFMKDAGNMSVVATGDAMEEVAKYEGEFGNGHSTAEPTPVTVDLPIEKAVVIIVALLLMAAFIMAAVTFYSKKRSLKRTEYLHEKIDEVPVKKKASYFSNEERVRRIYRQFLTVALSRNVKITPQMTSEEILEALNGRIDKKEAEALRNIYIGARYNEFGKVTDEDVKTAKEALKKLSA